MLAELRFALRQLARAPGFAAVTLCSLALGIGANTTLFSLVNEVLLKALPVRAPHELVLFHWAAHDESPRSLSGWNQRDPRTGETTSTSFSLRTFAQIAAADAPVRDVFAFAPATQLNVGIDGQAEVVNSGVLVSGNYHAALGVPIAVGRGLGPEDDTAAATPAVVLSHGFWQRRFGGEAAVLGQTITINRVPFTVVGVTAPSFAGTLQIGEVQDLTMTFATQPKLQPDNLEASEPWFWWVRIMARLQPGATPEQALAALAGPFRASIADAFDPGAARTEPPGNRVHLRVGSGAQGLVEARRQAERSLWVLGGLVVLVLLVACANVANLLLARGAARERELAVRLALGAGRGRLLRQLLTESLLLSGLGAALGLLFAQWGRSALMALRPLGPSVVLDLSLDWRVLAFTSLVAVATGLLFGFAPAWRATRLDLHAGAAAGARTLGGGARSPLARMLMVVQVALSIVLLVGAGLFTRTLANLNRLDPGFERSGLLLFRLDAMAAGRDRAELAPLYTRIAERLSSLPGVTGVTYAQMPLLAGSRWTSGMFVPGYTPAPGENQNMVLNGVDPGYFATYGLPLVLGRAFTARDDDAAPKVVVINQAFARKYFGDRSPVGQSIGFFGREQKADLEIVGVVRDVKHASLREEPTPAVYLPFAQLRNARWGNFALRVRGDPTALGPLVQAAVREIDATLPVANLRTQDEQLARMLTSERLFARLSAFFGGLALLLAGLGLYGLLSYQVVRRTGEIGLRVALGALPRRVVWLVVQESLLLVGLGLVLGLGAAAGASTYIASQLYGLTASDPATYAGVAGVLLLVALLAALLPARRAVRVDPMVALRTE